MGFQIYTMKPIAASELIINDRGALYHINCCPGEVAHTIITVGDPDRVKEVSKHFDSITYTNQHREFVTHTGSIGHKQLTVISTGIGPDNIDIVINELDALFNIDLDTRIVKEKHTALEIIRLGTSGALQAQIPVDSIVASTHAIGIDNLLNFYRHHNNDEELAILQAFNTHTQMEHITKPYLFSASAHLLKQFVADIAHGLTVTCPGFYAPQGRILRLGLAQPNLIDGLSKFAFGNYRITNFEMETAAIYGLGKLLGHHCLSLSAIVANRITNQFSNNGNAAVEKLIVKALDVLVNT